MLHSFEMISHKKHQTTNIQLIMQQCSHPICHCYSVCHCTGMYVVKIPVRTVSAKFAIHSSYFSLQQFFQFSYLFLNYISPTEWQKEVLRWHHWRHQQYINVRCYYSMVCSSVFLRHSGTQLSVKSAGKIKFHLLQTLINVTFFKHKNHNKQKQVIWAKLTRRAKTYSISSSVVIVSKIAYHLDSAHRDHNTHRP